MTSCMDANDVMHDVNDVMHDVNDVMHDANGRTSDKLLCIMSKRCRAVHDIRAVLLLVTIYRQN